MTISFVHFAVTGAIVAFHAFEKLLGNRYIMVRSKSRTLVVITLSMLICPFVIPVVLLLDTAVFVRQVLLLGKGCSEMLHLPCLHTMSARHFHWVFCDMPKMLGLSWIDLEIYEGMHNAIAAVLQSFPTVVINSALFALGNKPSHGVFFCNTLFAVAAGASFLSMLKSLALMLFLAYSNEISAVVYTCETLAGNTLASKNSTLQSNSQVELLVQRTQTVGLASPDELRIDG